MDLLTLQITKYLNFKKIIYVLKMNEVRYPDGMLPCIFPRPNQS